jgi:hypothetical protein
VCSWRAQSMVGSGSARLVQPTAGVVGSHSEPPFGSVAVGIRADGVGDGPHFGARPALLLAKATNGPSARRELDLAHAHPWTSCLLTANAVSSGGFVNPSALERTVDETWSNPRHCTADCDASRIRTRALEILSRRPRTRSHTSEQREWLHDRSDRTCNPELFNLRETRQTVPRRSLGSV